MRRTLLLMILLSLAACSDNAHELPQPRGDLIPVNADVPSDYLRGNNVESFNR